MEKLFPLDIITNRGLQTNLVKHSETKQVVLIK